MEHNDKEINKIVQDSFSRYTVSADEAVWRNIRKELDKPEKRRIAAWYYAAAASVAMLLSLYVYRITDKPETNVASASEQTGDTGPIRETGQPETAESSTSAVALNHDKPGLDSFDSPSTPVIEQTANKNLPKSKSLSEKQDESTIAATTVTQTAAQNAWNAPAPGIKINGDPARSKQAADSEIANTNATDLAVPETALTTKSNNKKEIASIPSETDEVVSLNEIVQEGNEITHNGNDTISPPVTIAEKQTVSPIIPGVIDLGADYEDAPKSQYEYQKWYLAANAQSSSGSREDLPQPPAKDRLVQKFVTEFENSTILGIPTIAGDFDKKPIIVFAERTYLPPFFTSVTLNYAFNRKWSIEGGISYSRLSSIRKTSESSMVKARQEEQLHYIGLPLLANYQLNNGRRLTTFISGGVVVNKGISHTSKLIFEDDKDQFNQSGNEKIKGIKYVTFLGLGLEYRFIPLIGVFFQPGISYFAATKPQPFDIGGSSATGFQPNIRLGLRFHLKKSDTK